MSVCTWTKYTQAYTDEWVDPVDLYNLCTTGAVDSYIFPRQLGFGDKEPERNSSRDPCEYQDKTVRRFTAEWI